MLTQLARSISLHTKVARLAIGVLRQAADRLRDGTPPATVASALDEAANVLTSRLSAS